MRLTTSRPSIPCLELTDEAGFLSLGTPKVSCPNVFTNYLINAVNASKYPRVISAICGRRVGKSSALRSIAVAKARESGSNVLLVVGSTAMLYHTVGALVAMGGSRTSSRLVHFGESNIHVCTPETLKRFFNGDGYRGRTSVGLLLLDEVDSIPTPPERFFSPSCVTVMVGGCDSLVLRKLHAEALNGSTNISIHVTSPLELQEAMRENLSFPEYSQECNMSYVL